MTDDDQPPHILFINATVVIGDDGCVPFEADVATSDGIIREIGPDLARENHLVVDARGCFLSPGFIDMHAHSDLYLLTHPEHDAKISQGCTTEVVGQDGISYYPIRHSDEMTSVREQIAGWNGNPTIEECGCGGHLEGLGLFEWNSVGDYLDCLERNRTATNVAVLVPQGNLRLLSCGAQNVAATSDQLEDQISLLREGMNDGAVGMSSGLTYTPGMYASTAELSALCAVLAKEFPGAYYAPHHRSYGLGALEAYGEMLDIARDTGCPLHLTHATLNFPKNKGKAPTLVKMIDAYLDSGTTVSLDTYPYLPGCTTVASILPSWAHAGGAVDTMRRLMDPVLQEKMRIAMEITGSDGFHGIPVDWDVVQVGTCFHPSLAQYSGRRIGEIARHFGRNGCDVYYEIMIKDRMATACLLHIGNEENVRTMMQHPTHCSGSDAILHGAFTHPRAYGTFPRFIAHYARDLGLMSIPEMVAHLTSRPAKRIGVYPHRGVLRIGSAADLVLFDPKIIMDKATYEQPKLKAEGIRWVLVNGHIAMEEGRLTGARSGRTIRRRRNGVVA